MESSYSFVRKSIVNEQPPPLTQVGITGWLWRNLFSSMSNFSSISSSILSILMISLTIWLLYFCGGLIYSFIDFAILSAVFTDPDGIKRKVCATVKQGGELPADWYGACWPFIFAKKKFLIYGRIPTEELWRANLVYAALVIGMGYVMWEKGKARKWVGLCMLTVFPVVSLILLTGANFDINTSLFIWTGILFIISYILGFLSARNYLGEILEQFSILFNFISIILFSFFILLILFAFDYGLAPIDTLDWGGLLLTLLIAITGIVASLPFGVLLALGRRSDMPIARLLCTMFIEFWRGIPLITVLFAASVLIPLFLPSGADVDKLLRAVIGIILFSSAYMAEVIRGGLQAIPRGQYESASAVGLSYSQSMRFIILPQALTHVLPGIVNTFIGLFKDTTLVSIIGIFEVMGILRSASQDANWGSHVQHSTSYLVAATVFFIFCFGMSRYSIFIENKLSRENK
ncbi:MAG: amino acid ABC transporter permease [Candidatus Puniceispirillales bacterium]|tara:strand:- start:145 stop:1527 length:1383 start_codon:yes stop_codon:yes gene_type:complete